MHLLPPQLRIGTRRAPQSPGDELDRELARGMLDGSRESLGHFIDRQLGPLARYLERRLGPGHEAHIAAIAQSTLRDAAHHLKPYAYGSPSTPIRLWLIRRAERYVRKLHGKGRQKAEGRRQKVEDANIEAHSVSTQPLPERGSLDWLRVALASMPGRQNMALSLALFEQLGPVEIGQAMGVTTGRAMRILRRALLRVNKRIVAGHGGGKG